jgi:ketosteroid isomerase-like protein
MAVVDDETIELVSSVGSTLVEGDILEVLADPRLSARLSESIGAVAAPDFECVMVAPDYVGPRGRLTYSGPDGFIEAWRDWSEAYESYRIEIEDIVEGTEGRVLLLARQLGRTRTGGVDVEELAGAVWTVRDGKLARMEFHLDPDSARRAAGLDD